MVIQWGIMAICGDRNDMLPCLRWWYMLKSNQGGKLLITHNVRINENSCFFPQIPHQQTRCRRGIMRYPYDFQGGNQPTFTLEFQRKRHRFHPNDPTKRGASSPTKSGWSVSSASQNIPESWEFISTGDWRWILMGIFGCWFTEIKEFLLKKVACDPFDALILDHFQLASHHDALTFNTGAHLTNIDQQCLVTEPSAV